MWTRLTLLSLALVACEQNPDTDPDSDAPVACDAVEGDICPWAGTGDNGYNGDGRDRKETMFSFPMSATFSPFGPVMIADWNNHKIRKVNADDTITTVMGTDFLGDGDPSRLDMTPGGAPGTTVNLNHPTMQQYWSDGTLVSASWHTHKLRTQDLTTGTVNVVLGRGPGFSPAEDPADRGAPVADDGCLLNQPKSIEIDSGDNVYVLDMRNERIRYWDRANATMTTIAGNGFKANLPADEANCTNTTGDALSVCFAFPKNSNPEPGGAIALDEAGQVMYIADTEVHVIRKLDLATRQLTILAGQYKTAGYTDATGEAAAFNFPTDVELDGNTLFVADANNHAIRAIDLTTGAVTTVAGNGEPTCADGAVGGGAGDSGLTYVPVVCADQKTAGDGGPAVDATLFRPFGIDLDLEGNLVIADTYNHRFRILYR
jgi:hypothetical protein